MSGLPSALYFPYIDLDAETLRAFLVLFREIRLLQPSFSVPGSWTEGAEKRGWVRIARPLPLNLDARGARAMFREYERLGNLYQDSGYLAYLKHGGAHRLEEEPGYGLVREIRHYGTPSSPPDDRETLRGQILLQMAQDLDRQRREIQEALGDVRQREGAMLRSLGSGLDDPEAVDWEMEPLPSVEEDDFLIPQRLRAWAELIEAEEDPSPAILLTDNRLVVDHLMEEAAQRKTEGVQGPLGLLQVPVPRFVPAQLEETAKLRQALADLLPWTIFCEKLEELVREARTAVWSAAVERDLLARGRALASYFQENVRDGLLEKVTALEPAWGEGWRECTMEIVLFPGWTDGELLRARPPAKAPKDNSNAVILHLDGSDGPSGRRLAGEDRS